MYRAICIALAALAASSVAAQEARRPDPADPKAKAPPAEYRSAFDGYRPFADEELSDWRRANDEVGAAGGHLGHRPGQAAGRPGAKPQPGSAESAGQPAPSSAHGGHSR